MNKVAIIGCGGIGSYLFEFINRSIMNKQLPSSIEFTAFDGDSVEHKNLTYQNFLIKDIARNKASALASRYPMVTPVARFATKEDLEKFDMSILCVDNNNLRQAALALYQEKAIDFIDLRANGRMIGVYFPENNYEKVTDFRITDSTSCQQEYQMREQLVDYGNLIIASIGIQLIVNNHRGTLNRTNITLHI